MFKHSPISDVELMKLLVDPRRTRILELASEIPQTVGQLAEQLGELASRVYYHVHKLEQAGLLEVVETRQQGNLIEKYYQCTEKHLALKVDPVFLNQNLHFVTGELERVLLPGLQMINEKVLRKGSASANGSQSTDEKLRARLSISWENMSETEWKRQFDHRLGQPHTLTEQEVESTIDAGSEEKDSYVFITLGYNLNDAERLGFYKPPKDEESHE